jgi:hypothetical protein
LKRARLTAPGRPLEVGQDIAGAHSPGCQHAEIPAGDAVFGDVGGDALDAAARVDLPAGRARLGDLQAAVPSAKMSPMQAPLR